MIPSTPTSVVPIPARPIQSPDQLSGDWTGKLSVGAASLRLVFHVKPLPGGGWSATMDSPDQGAYGLPATGVRLENRSVTIAYDAIKAGLTGELAEDGKRISGKWSQAGRDFSVELTRSAKPVERPRRPQEPRPPFPYRAEDIRFESRAPGIALAGTLCTPAGAGPFPAVVLVSGSGPQDRDETLVGHRPFAVLADQLARAGIASLRYDDRGIGKSTGDFETASSADFADDAEGAVRYLAKHPRIRKDRIGIAGHSEGGLIGPLVAERCREVGFLILLAGPGVPGMQILPAQSNAIQQAMGVSREIRSKNLLLQRELIDLALEFGVATPGGKPNRELARARLGQAIDRFVASLDENQKAAFGSERAPLEAQFDGMLSPWFRFFLNHDPRPTLRRVKVPVLVLNGSRDLQVLADQNVPEIIWALRSGGNRHVQSRILPGLNHLFQTCRLGTPDEYGALEESFAPKAMREMVAWVRSLG